MIAVDEGKLALLAAAYMYCNVTYVSYPSEYGNETLNCCVLYRELMSATKGAGLSSLGSFLARKGMFF